MTERPTAELVRGEGPLSVFDAFFFPVWTRERIEREMPTHPPTDECPDGPDNECMVCGTRDCPLDEPLHYHHDGCPAEWAAEQRAKAGA